MRSSAFWKAVLVDRENLLDRFLEFLRSSGTRFCLIGGAGINSYTYPVVTEDLDIVVAAGEVEKLETSLSHRFTVRRFPHSINVSAPGSKLQVQIQTDERYFDFVDRATEREVMDYRLPVARIEASCRGRSGLRSTRPRVRASS